MITDTVWTSDVALNNAYLGLLRLNNTIFLSFYSSDNGLIDIYKKKMGRGMENEMIASKL